MSAPQITLTLLDGRSTTRLEQITSLIAQDASGQFGILPGHVKLVTLLEPGLFRYRVGDGTAWFHGASAGGMLSCQRDAGSTQVRIVSRRFLLGDEPETLQKQLDELLASERTLRMSTRDSVAQLEHAFYKRMQQLAQSSSTDRLGAGTS